MIDTVLSLGIVVFAITYMIRYLHGPGDIFEKLRNTVNIYNVPVYKDDFTIVDYIEEIRSESTITKLYACFWCLGTWVALIVSIIYVILYQDWKAWLFIWLGSIGIAGFVKDIAYG